MDFNRRNVLKTGLAAFAAFQASVATEAAPTAPTSSVANPDYQRIACEEHWTTREILTAQIKLLDTPWATEQPYVAGMVRTLVQAPKDLGLGAGIQDLLLDLGEGRIRNMDGLGIHKQVLLLTAPGVQIFDADTGTGLAQSANDVLAQAVRNHPDRLAGLAVVAPQDPKRAVRELERGMTRLGLHGMIVNSHINGEYLDERKYWPLLEAAAELEAPIYIHPTPPPAQMGRAYAWRGLEGGLGGFAHDVWLHTMGIITSGAMDEFPKLKIVLGHLGEAMPLHMYRFDETQNNMERAGLRGIPEGTKLKRRISDYMRDNVFVTTSGGMWGPGIKFVQEVLGVDHVLYAMDYPYRMSANHVAPVDALSVSADIKKKLFQTNAEQLFRLNTV
jgi:predicted TIM-barrel fold metal-dependent hydrolase